MDRVGMQTKVTAIEKIGGLGPQLTKQQKQMIKKMIDNKLDITLEDKFVEFSTSNSFSYATIYPTTVIPQGVGVNQRTGFEIKPKDFWMNWNVAVADSVNTCRLIVVQYMPVVNQTAVTVPMIWSLNNGFSPFGFPNWQNKGDFKILYDSKMFASGLTGEGIVVGKIKPEIKKFRKITYSDATGNTAGGHIFLLLFNDSAATPHPNFSFNYRITYEDA